MNIGKLKEAEALFLQQYPDGFADEGLARVRKSHNVGKLSEFTKETLTSTLFQQPEKFAESLVTIISRASMVSRFEKPKFRDLMQSLDSNDKEHLASAFEKRLAGNAKEREQGFNAILDLLSWHKLARWSVISAVPFYYDPLGEAFVKPTTAKKIISYLEITNLHYHPRPDWDFYQGYLKLIMDIRAQVSASLTPNNAALTGFLMVST